MMSNPSKICLHQLLKDSLRKDLNSLGLNVVDELDLNLVFRTVSRLFERDDFHHFVASAMRLANELAAQSLNKLDATPYLNASVAERLREFHNNPFIGSLDHHSIQELVLFEITAVISCLTSEIRQFLELPGLYTAECSRLHVEDCDEDCSYSFGCTCVCDCELADESECKVHQISLANAVGRKIYSLVEEELQADKCVGETGDAIWELNHDDKEYFVEVAVFLRSLVDPDLPPKTLCQLAAAINYLDRMPRFTSWEFTMEIIPTKHDDSLSLRIHVTESAVVLSEWRPGAGVQDDGYETEIFRRTSAGDAHGTDVWDWISDAKELMECGGVLAFPSESLGEFDWSDGDSNRYWELLRDDPWDDG